MKNTIVFPGSFDPWTYGHEATVKDYLDLSPWANVDVLIGVNPAKNPTFTPEEKKILIEKTVEDDVKQRMNVVVYDRLVAEYVYENAKIWVLKWARTAEDFNYEMWIAQATQKFSARVKTIIIPQLNPVQTGVSSSILKAISKFSGDVAAYASPLVREALRLRQSEKFLIGVTGWIASGKSTLCKNLEDYSRTQEIHERKDLPIFQEIRNELAVKFGENILNPDGTTNKKILWDIVFQNPFAMQELMKSILEPLIYFLRKKVDSIKSPAIILVEWAIIFDRNLTYLFDENIVHIWVSRAEQEKRIKLRDSLTPEQIAARLWNQLSREQRVAGLKNLQEKYKNQDRLLLDVDGKDVSVPEVYERIVAEYKARKNFEYK
mgnify:CR=1 FL=1